MNNTIKFYFGTQVNFLVSINAGGTTTEGHKCITPQCWEQQEGVFLRLDKD